MPVSGLVITLSEKPQDQAAVMAALAGNPHIDIGEATGPRVPIVVDAPTSEEDRHIWEWLHNLPGVVFVDVACIHFDDEEQKHPTEART